VWTSDGSGNGSWQTPSGATDVPGADYTGATDSTAAINAAIASLPANGGTVALGPGTLKTSSPLVISTGVRITGAGKHATKITSTSASSIFSFSGNAYWWDVSNLTAVNSGGHIFAGTGNLSAFRVHDVSLQCNSNTSSIWAQSGGALIEGYFSYCDLSCNGTAPSVAAFNLADTAGVFNANVFEKCVCTYNSASTVYFFNWVCTSGSEFSFGNVWRDVVFEQCVAGAIFAQGHFGAELDNVSLWDSSAIGNSVADFIHFGKYTSGLSSRGIMIRNGSRQNSALGGGFYDISFDASSQQVTIDGFRASPDNANFNLNGCIAQVRSQSPGTTITNGTGTVSQFTGSGAPGSVAVWNARIGDTYTDQAATSGHTISRCTTAGNPGTWTALV
jgi:hypothetical protein